MYLLLFILFCFVFCFIFCVFFLTKGFFLTKATMDKVINNRLPKEETTMSETAKELTSRPL